MNAESRSTLFGRPLAGVRVLDLTRVLAGPFATMILADLGADVLKVERPGAGDDTRAIGPHFVDGESSYFLSINRGKRSVAIDLSRPEGRGVLRDLATSCDVVIDNFRAGVAERLGCDAATLHAANPRLVVCSMTAFGLTGPDRDLPAFDLTLQARGGTMGLTGEPGRMPVRMGPPMGDLAGGLYAVIAITAELAARAREPQRDGVFIDLSLLDCQASLLTYAASFYLNNGAVLGPQGSAHAHATPYEAFETADGPIAIAVFTEAFWPGFCRALEKPAWIDDPRFVTARMRRERSQDFLAAVRSELATRTAREWLDRFREQDVPCAPVQSIDAVFADPQIIARHMVIESARAGHSQPVRTVGSPLSGGRAQTDVGPPPRLGEHTEEILRQVAGYDPERIVMLRRLGIVA